MKYKTLLQDFKFLFFMSVLAISCQYDPHANLLTTSEPREEDVVGTYVLDRYDLPDSLTPKKPDTRVELRADGTFTAINVPPWKLGDPDVAFVSSFHSGEGKWDKSIMGTLDPGSKKIWGIYLRTGDSQFHPADFTGDKPPYGLIFTFGDPDSGNAILLKRTK
jgi:hypothetical protein